MRGAEGKAGSWISLADSGFRGHEVGCVEVIGHSLVGFDAESYVGRCAFHIGSVGCERSVSVKLECDGSLGGEACAVGRYGELRIGCRCSAGGRNADLIAGNKCGFQNTVSFRGDGTRQHYRFADAECDGLVFGRIYRGVFFRARCEKKCADCYECKFFHDNILFYDFF